MCVQKQPDFHAEQAYKWLAVLNKRGKRAFRFYISLMRESLPVAFLMSSIWLPLPQDVCTLVCPCVCHQHLTKGYLNDAPLLWRGNHLRHLGIDECSVINIIILPWLPVCVCVLCTCYILTTKVSIQSENIFTTFWLVLALQKAFLRIIIVKNNSNNNN